MENQYKKKSGRPGNDSAEVLDNHDWLENQSLDSRLRYASDSSAWFYLVNETAAAGR